jgi:chromosome segregation ATPase
MMENPNDAGVPMPIADLIAQLQLARAEAKDAQVHLDALRAQYAGLEAICGTQADDLARLRKVEAAHAALQAEQAQLRERIGRLQAQVNQQKSVVGTLRLVFWQIRRLPGLLLRGK